MTINRSAARLVCAGRGQTAFLFVITCRELQMYQFKQHFKIRDTDIIRLIAMQPEVPIRPDTPIEPGMRAQAESHL
jgi:hypothetical protein